MGGLFIQALLLVIESLAGFFTVLLLLRFFMQLFRASFNNPVGVFVLNLTNWLIMPLRKVIPPVSGLDSASLMGAFLLQAVLLLAVVALRSGFEMTGLASMAFLILTRSLLAVLRISIYLFIGLLIIQAVLSWFNPYSPLSRPIGQMTDPLLRPLRRIVPPVSNIDLTPLVAILLAQVVLIFL